MRRLASVLSWVLLPFVAIIVLTIVAGGPPRFSAPLPLDKNGESSQTNAFAGFPVDSPRSIDFDLDENTTNQLTTREQVDQQRDWLLYTVVVDSGASADTLNRSLYDLAPIRHGYLRHVSRFEYGTTRSCVLGDNHVIALVPKADPKQRADDLAHIFDEARKNLGVVPGELTVFEYSLDAPDKATVTRRAAVPGRALLETAAGYREASVKSVEDLDKFMTSIDDLVFARNEADVLKLGGRKLANAQYRNIRVEDVAAIWQAEEKIHVDLRDFKARWDRRLEEFQSTWRSNHPYGTQSEFNQSVEQEMRQPYEEERKRLHVVEGCGFSLDPDYDYKGLAAALSKPTFAELLTASGLSEDARAALLRYAVFLHLGDKKATRAVVAAAAQTLPVTSLMRRAQIPESELRRAIAALQAESAGVQKRTKSPFGSIDFSNLLATPTPRPVPGEPSVLPFLELIKHLREREKADSDDAGLLKVVFQDFDNHYRFQAARYDGPLDGTEVGMVLFYTDLIAKLWALDYIGSTPSSNVSDFNPMTRNILPSLYRAEEIELPNTRLWFGPEDNGYQIVDRITLHLARGCTRIYSASSNPLEPGKEVAPNANSEAFLGWWNDHFEEVAEYEPQYQRLNQIMKWSLLVSWLERQSASERIRFLADVQVNTSAWFPQWARKSSDLRFRDWEKVDFFERGYLGTHTEAMPILVSYPYKNFADETTANWTLSGGVSLASKELLQARAPLSAELPSMMRRSGVDYGKAVHGSDDLVTFRGTRYSFSAAEKAITAGTRGIGREVAIVKMAAKDGLKYRARFGEMSEGRFERVVERVGENARIEGRAAAGEIGHLNVAPSRNGFRVGWRAREVDDGYAIAQRLSSSKDFAASLKNDPLVEAAIAEQNTDAYYVKSCGSRKWIKLAPEGEPSPDVAIGWNGRVADIVPEAKPVNIAWIDEAQIPAQIRDGGNWIRGPPRRSDRISGLGGEPPGPNIREATAAILHDPRAYKLKLDAQFKQYLDEIDQLLAAGQPRKALAIIEEGVGKFGGHEQLRFRQALSELADRRPDAAADAVNDIKLANRDQTVLLIDEVNSRLKQANDPELRRIAESADWRTTSSRPAGDEVLLTTTKDGTLDHELRLKQAPEGLPVKPDAVPADALVYFQDTPELNSIDWNTSVRTSLDQVGEFVDVVELPRGDIAHFNPAYIATPKTRFSRAGTYASARSANAAGTATAYRVWGGGNSGGDDDDDDEKDENGFPRHRKGKVFLVVARAAGS